MWELAPTTNMGRKFYKKAWSAVKSSASRHCWPTRNYQPSSPGNKPGKQRAKNYAIEHQYHQLSIHGRVACRAFFWCSSGNKKARDNIAAICARAPSHPFFYLGQKSRTAFLTLGWNPVTRCLPCNVCLSLSWFLGPAEVWIYISSAEKARLPRGAIQIKNTRPWRRPLGSGRAWENKKPRGRWSRGTCPGGGGLATPPVKSLDAMLFVVQVVKPASKLEPTHTRWQRPRQPSQWPMRLLKVGNRLACLFSFGQSF